jgi:teichuronic acid biosynthesis glycosyltransferase TuaC
MRVLMLTSVWPTKEHPEHAPFVVRQATFLRNAGVDVDVFHVNGRKNPVAYFRAWREVQRRLTGGSYDLIHAQWAQAALPSLPSRLPLVVTFRGSDVEGIVNANQSYSASGWALRKIACGVARAADEAILVAARLARLLPRRKYHVIPSGLDLDLFRPYPQHESRDRLGLARDRRYILFAASPENPVKRYALARAAVDRLEARHRAELIVTAGVDPSRMPLYISACDVLIVTSAHEGSPNVVKEALACNLPVVSADVGDVAERIANIDGCVLCRRGDPAEFAAGLAVVLDRNQRIAGRAAVEELSEPVLTRKVIGVYEGALRRRAVRKRASSDVRGIVSPLPDGRGSDESA